MRPIPSLGWEITVGEVCGVSPSLPHIIQQQFPSLSGHVCLSTRLLTLFPKGSPAGRLQRAWIKYFIVANTRHSQVMLASQLTTCNLYRLGENKAAKHILHSKTKLLRKAGTWSFCCYYYGNMSDHKTCCHDTVKITLPSHVKETFPGCTTQVM